jgi:hypothetical protein
MFRWRGRLVQLLFRWPRTGELFHNVNDISINALRPRASIGPVSLYGLPPVASLKFKLSLPAILFALVFYVGLNGALVSADSRSKVAN